MQQKADKTFYDLRAGLVTEAGPLATPDGATVDEQNFHLLIDGSRRRRRGLKTEYGGTPLPLDAFNSTHATRVGKWKNAGDNPEDDFVVVQIGPTLHFFKDEGTNVSSKYQTSTIDLTPFVTNTLVDWEHYPVSITSGNGYLVVTGRYVQPFTIELKEGIFIPKEIQTTIRDFTGYASDTTALSTQPTELTPEHRYNLRNRGWREQDIEAYFDAEGKYPSLNMLWHKGYAREVDDTVYSTDDGVKVFNPEKISAEPFGNQSAPQGALLVNPFDTTTGATAFIDPNEIVDWSYTDWSATHWIVSLTTATPHNLSTADRFYISGHYSSYLYEEAQPAGLPLTADEALSFDGLRVAWVGTEGTTLTFFYPKPSGFAGWLNQYVSYGAIDNGEILTNPQGYSTKERPTATAWYAGRVWMAGTRFSKLADKILFSQTATNRQELGNYYQFNDPTNDDLNQLVATDGGVLQLSDIGNVQGLLPYQNVLLVLCDNGVWEISGGRGMFAPDNFFIRKVTDAKCISPWGFVEAEGRVFFLGPEGIFTIQPDQYTSVLYATSITEQSIQSEWLSVSSAQQRIAKMVYDAVNKQVWVLTDVPIRVSGVVPGPVRHQRSFLIGHNGSVFTELSGDVPEDDNRAVFWSTSSTGPWVQHSWDAWSNTGIAITPSSAVPPGTVWWKVRTRSGVESAPFQGTVSAQTVTIPTPPFNPGEDGTDDVTILAMTLDGPPPYQYPSALTYDIRLNAWHKFQFPRTTSSGVISDVFTTRDTADCGTFRNLKFLVLGYPEMLVCDLCSGPETSDLYTDWDGTEVEAFLLMGADGIGNWHSFRQAPVVHVHSYATDLAPNVNESSILMRARWDWTDNVYTGKWGSEQQVHRRSRPFVPMYSSGWDDGYPVVVTRNKVRGRGRALQLVFRSEEGHDAHLLGYAIRYAVTGRV